MSRSRQKTAICAQCGPIALNYTPLETDALLYGRQLIIGDINHLLLDDGKPVPAVNRDKFPFDFARWKPIPELVSMANEKLTSIDDTTARGNIARALAPPLK